MEIDELEVSDTIRTVNRLLNALEFSQVSAPCAMSSMCIALARFAMVLGCSESDVLNGISVAWKSNSAGQDRSGGK